MNFNLSKTMTLKNQKLLPILTKFNLEKDFKMANLGPRNTTTAKISYNALLFVQPIINIYIFFNQVAIKKITISH